MVESGYRLITEGLEVAHLRLIVGSSMGGMHAWDCLFGGAYGSTVGLNWERSAVGN
jgi:homoserine O-acetyltransferase/O-succinyltransferase